MGANDPKSPTLSTSADQGGGVSTKIPKDEQGRTSPAPQKVEHLSRKERKARGRLPGKRCRARATRSSLPTCAWTRSTFEGAVEDEGPRARADPLRAHGVSAFTFYRGGALIMAADLSTTPTTGLVVQLCGDAHLSNFGIFGSPERHLVFDVNDFDETSVGPWGSGT